jgi:hypothetical protein
MVIPARITEADARRATAGSPRTTTEKAAFIALIVIRLLCAALWTWMAAVGGGGFFLLIPAGWNVLPVVLARASIRVAVWLIIISDAVVIVLGLLVLRDSGHLHGGEIVGYAAIPAVVEVVLGAIVLTMRRAP